MRITRELNNFHSETELEEARIPIREKEKYIQLLYECDDLFRENAQLLKRSGNAFIDDESLKTFPEEGFVNLTPNENQLVFVEKMLIELKAIRVGLESPQIPGSRKQAQ